MSPDPLHRQLHDLYEHHSYCRRDGRRIALPCRPGRWPDFGQAYYNSDKAITSISFDWGSPDSYNLLAFISPVYGNAFVNLIGYTGAVSGSNVTLVDGRATFNFLASDKVTKVGFASSERAFEIDNVSATAVPEPGVWALLLVGFGMVGLSARRRSSAVPA